VVAAASASSPLRRILSVILFGIAFGYLEASVVVYLRTLGGPIRAAAGLPAESLFPLLPLDRLSPALLALVKIELPREAATLIMLAAVAFAVSRDPHRRLGAFLLAFGVWDLTFYLWLRVLLGWPPSLLTWDILFLLPVPWAAPVLAPVIIATTMSIFGARLLAIPPSPVPKLAPKIGGVVLIAGALIVLGTFTWDWRRWLAGGMPEHYPWSIFALGEALIIAGFLSFLRPVSLSRNYIQAETSNPE
jgi:hypothetical protein